MKRLRAATHPVNFCICLRSFGTSNCDKAWIFAGFASIPLPDTMKPKSFPAGTPKTHFSGLSLMSYFQRLSNVSLKSSTRDSTCFDLTTTSIHIRLHCFADLVCQTCLYHALICCAGVFQPEGHCVEAEWVVWCDECCCGLV